MVHSTTDPCLYHKWSDNRLVLRVSWIDDNLIIGTKKAVEKTKKELMEIFDCKDCGDLEEYVGCKIERKRDSLKFAQPILLQSFSDNFELLITTYKTLVHAGSVLVAGKKVEVLSPAMQK